jgi:hypothetical protein
MEKELSSKVLDKSAQIKKNMIKKNKRKLVKSYGKDAERVVVGKSINAAKKAIEMEENNTNKTRIKELVRKALMQETDLEEASKKAKRDYDGDGTIESSEEEYKGSRDKAIKKAKGVSEDLDLGHEDDEPHHIKSELYKIGKYSMMLYSIMDELEERGGEIDLPAWWQSKITKAATMLGSAKHYLEFELAEPKVDAFIDRVTGEEPREDESSMMSEADKDKEGLMYALATNLKKYGRPQSKSSDKPAKLTKSLEKGREKYVKKLKKHMDESISEKIAKKLKNPNA